MLKANDPARRGEAVDGLLAGDDHGHNTAAFRKEVLAERFHITPARAALIGRLAFGESANG